MLLFPKIKFKLKQARSCHKNMIINISQSVLLLRLAYYVYCPLFDILFQQIFRIWWHSVEKIIRRPGLTPVFHLSCTVSLP